MAECETYNLSAHLASDVSRCFCAAWDQQNLCWLLAPSTFLPRKNNTIACCLICTALVSIITICHEFSISLDTFLFLEGPSLPGMPPPLKYSSELPVIIATHAGNTTMSLSICAGPVGFGWKKTFQHMVRDTTIFSNKAERASHRRHH